MSKFTGGDYDVIKERCPRCATGYRDGSDIFCTHWKHPMVVGGCGTEWAATCNEFKDTGKVGVLKRTVVRE